MLHFEIKDKMEDFERRKSFYIKTITSFYESKMNDIDKVEDEKM